MRKKKDRHVVLSMKNCRFNKEKSQRESETGKETRKRDFGLE